MFETVVATVFVLVVLATVVVDKTDLFDEPEPGTEEYVRHLYTTGQIDDEEMERRLDVVVDPEASRIREMTERVNDIGEKRSWDIAARFETCDEVRDASTEELEEIPGIGEKRAKALKENL